MQYYSQFGQDQYLYENFFRGYENGYFVDIGAHDGVTGSNTKFFEDIGWRGICFEPIPSVYQKLSANRKCDVCPCAISDIDGRAGFRVIKGYSEMLSGLADSQYGEQLSRINREVAEHEQQVDIIEVETRKFSSIVPRTSIDLLSLDVEGAEEKIIRSIPFDVFNIRFMTIEFNNPNDSLERYLNSRGYECINQLGVDKIFKKN